jgi:hypothetical protein
MSNFAAYYSVSYSWVQFLKWPVQRIFLQPPLGGQVIDL